MLDYLIAVLASLEPMTVVLAVVIFFFAGIIKGVVGFGMPLFAISTLALFMPLTTAIAANIGPSLVTNVRQAFRGPYLVALLRRLWPFLVPAIGLIWLGIAVQVRINPAYPGLMLGLLALAFVGLRLFKFAPTIRAKVERPVGFVVGCINGVVAGLTGVFILPSGLFLQSLDLNRDELVQALGLLFMLSTATIGLVFGFTSLLTPGLVVLSVLCIPSGLAGLVIGEWLRSKLSEAMFTQLFLAGLALLGLALVVRNGNSLMGAG